MKDWFVYMVRCNDGSLYTGITTDLKRRIDEHNCGREAAAYTRSRRPVELVYQERCRSRSKALIREGQIRKMQKSEKEIMINDSG